MLWTLPLLTLDVREYSRIIAQTFSGILAAQWINRDSADLRCWLVKNGYLDLK